MKNFESDDEVDMEPKEAIELFAERVTISGLKEAYGAKIKRVRIMFRAALTFCSIMIVYKTNDILVHYQHQKIVFVDLELTGVQAPFPNVSICLPYFINETTINQWNLPERLLERMRKFNLTTSNITDAVASVLFWGFDMFHPEHVARTVVTREAFRAAAKDAVKKGKSVWEFLWPSCSATLSNCEFDGQPFDCCQAATMVPFMTTPCVQIRGDVLVNISKNRNNDPLRLQDTGLTFDVNTAWTSSVTTFDTDNGYHVYIDEPPLIFKVPVHVPAQMDVLLNLAEPKRVNQITDCVSNEKVPKLKYYDDYDNQGNQCQADYLIDLGVNLLGCLTPLGSFIPVNNSCLYEGWVIISLLLDGGAEAFDDKLPMTSSSAGVGAGAMNRKETQTHDNVKISVSKDSPCKPLCSRWTYPVFSASYSSIEYRDTELENIRLANRSWSRIRVILPSTSSSHKEEPRHSSYLAFCDIRGMMSIYAGISVVTYVQILAYGVYIFWCLLQKKRERCKIRKQIRVSVVVNSSLQSTFFERNEKASETEVKQKVTKDVSDVSFSLQSTSLIYNAVDVLDTELCLPGTVSN